MNFLNISDYTVLDLETTGLNCELCEIIEVAAIRVRDNKVVAEYQQLCAPLNGISAFIEELTGITREMLEDKPSFCEIATEFQSFIGQDIIVGHNVNFDMKFMATKCIGLPELDLHNSCIDTLHISNKYYSNWKNHKLTTMCCELNAPDNGAHRALSDCYSTWFCLEEMKRQISNGTAKLTAKSRPSLNKPKRFEFSNSKIKISDIQPENDTFDCKNPFYLKTCVFTGELKLFERQDAMQIVVNAGGIVRTAVSSKTNFLIVGSTEDNPILHGKKSSKELEAQSLIEKGKNIKILTENEFYNIINSDENEFVEGF